MKRTLAVIFLAALTAPATWAAGGTPAPEISPEDRAQDAYQRGQRYRDEALRIEAEAATEEGAARDKKQAKAAKEWTKAVRSYRNAVELDPALHQAHSDLGFALRKSGDYEASLAAYDRALELAPGYGQAIEYRAEAYLRLGRLDEVKAAYMELFRQDRPLADQLLGAILAWVEERSADPAGLDPAALEEFTGWASERAQAAGLTADLATGSAAVGW